MVEINWVGFRRSPKQDKSLVRALQQSTFLSVSDAARVFRAFSEASELTQWFHKTTKVDFRNGGSLTLDPPKTVDNEPNTANFANIQVGKRVVFVSDGLGEVDIRLKPQGTNFLVEIKITKFLPELLVSDFETKATEVISRLQKMIGLENG